MIGEVKRITPKQKDFLVALDEHKDGMSWSKARTMFQASTILSLLRLNIIVFYKARHGNRLKRAES